MNPIVAVTDTNFENEVLHSQSPVLVDFSATWCGPCKRLEPIVDQIATEYGDRIKVVKVDVDEARQTAARFAILSVPTLMFFRNGQVKDQFVGLLTKQALADRVEKVL